MSTDKQGKQDTVDDPDKVRAEIEKTRQDLGDTVQALSHKVDVKGRVSDGIEERKQQARDTAAHARETISQAGTRAQEQAAGAASSVKETADQAGQRVRVSRTPAIAGAALAAGLLALLLRWRGSR